MKANINGTELELTPTEYVELIGLLQPKRTKEKRATPKPVVKKTRKKKQQYNYWTEEEDKKVIEIFKLPRTPGGYVRKELLDALCKELPRHTRKAISHRGRKLVDQGDPMRKLLLRQRWSQ